MNKTDVLVIGAGPSGSISAAILKQLGYQVTIIEKTKFPRFVIGESLLPHCMDLLQEAQLLEVVENCGFQKKYGAKFIHESGICDFNFSEQYTKGWTWTWQVPRADFDKVLVDHVESKGAKVHYETSVEGVQFLSDKVLTEISSKDGTSTIESKFIIDSSGYGRVLPRLLNLDAPSDFPPRAAFFAHLKDPLRPDNVDGNRIQVVVLKKDIWVWIIPFSNGNTSVGVVGDLSFLDETLHPTEKFNQLLQSHPFLSDRFGVSEFAMEPQTISGYATSVKQFYGDRFVLTGNSTEFLDPIFSSGVTLALESGSRAAKLVAKQLSGETVSWQDEYVNPIQQGVDTFRSYVKAWYDGSLQTIFFTSEINQEIKNRICSVLAGYVWDTTNPYVSKHWTSIQSLAKVISINQRNKA